MSQRKAETGKEYYQRNKWRWRLYNIRRKDAMRAYYKKRAAAAWDLLADVYGVGCSCCGEKERRFLTLDHIHGGGKAHRKQIAGGGSSMYRLYEAVAKEADPNKYRLLCMNCNWAIRYGDPCPHQLLTSHRN